MKAARRLRELPPASAWNEAVRRAMALSIGGFFVPNLLAEFGVVPQLHQSFHFIVGVCGAAGVFSVSLALFIGSYHRKAIQGILVGSVGLALPYAATWVWFRMTHPSDSAGLLQLTGPPVFVAIVLYVALMRWHAGQSRLTSAALSEQVGTDEYGKPKARWEQVTYRVFSIIGSILILLLILGALTGRP